jgi:hypothetical protein
MSTPRAADETGRRAAELPICLLEGRGGSESADVLTFIAAQRRPQGDGRVVRLDGEAGLSAATIKRRVASVLGLFNYLVVIGEVAANPVPRGLSRAGSVAGGAGRH